MQAQGTTLERERARLRAAGQEHVLAFYDRLDASERQRLLAQIASLDIEGLPALVERYVRKKESYHLPDSIEPAPYYPRDPASAPRKWDRDRARAAGEALLRDGAVAVFTVAGGQGTRLGYDGPKGTFPGTPVTGKPLFACIAEWLTAARLRYGRAVPWYIMTSPLNHEPTVSFFGENGFFGLDERDVMFFSQGVLPSLDMETGRLLLADRGEIATNPDGHGGSLKALHHSGALADMKKRGVRHLSYTQIDNPLCRAIDPVFLGLHASAPDSSGEMSSKMVAKTDPSEKVGVFCAAGGKTRVIEYSDLPAELASQRDERGELRFNAGSIAIHTIGVEFIERLNTGGGGGGFGLPLHRAEKKVPFVDLETGERVEPSKPNAVKLEAFVFDAIPLAESSIVYETDRIEEFAPIKNADGKDSPETCARIQTERAARWLESRGVAVPRGAEGEPDCVLEIGPITAMEAGDLDLSRLPREIPRGARLAL